MLKLAKKVEIFIAWICSLIIPSNKLSVAEKVLVAHERSFPLKVMIRKGEDWILEELNTKAPELVEPLQALFDLHFGNLDIETQVFLELPEVIKMDTWNKAIEKLSKFMNELPGNMELQNHALLRHPEQVVELPPWLKEA